jgi:GR25 family glycosyltransferase involved in LPS biosynthesis
MKAYVITLHNNEFSQRKANRCIETGKVVGKVDVEKFTAIDKTNAQQVMKEHGLKWTYAHNNTKPALCPISGLKQIPYYNANLNSKIGCSMSHYLLYKKCVELDEPIIILEHDAVFIREMPEVDFKGILQINDPRGAGKNGRRLSESMITRGAVGVQPKTPNTTDPLVPDGIAGNSAYVIKPFAAQELIDKYHTLGIWPNDAIMCVQLFPYLEEYYPFITRVEHEGVSTSST